MRFHSTFGKFSVMSAQDYQFTWSTQDLKELEDNCLDEMSSRWMYLALAGLDRKPGRAELLRSLAGYEKEHAEAWADLLRRLNHPLPPEKPFWNHRLLVGLARVFGVGAVIPTLHKMEVDGLGRYKRQADQWKDPAVGRVFERILPEEMAHEVDTFNAMRRLAATRGILRSAILGANDGLTSLLALVAGVAGATASTGSVLVAGIAGLVAGALSMASSNYVSVKAEQEVYKTQSDLQRDALAVAPGTRSQMVQEIYRQKGLSDKEAETVAKSLMGRPAECLRTLLAEQYGIVQDNLENSLRQGFVTGLAFAAAGLVPVLPFLVLPVRTATVVSVLLTGAALFVTGVIRSLSTLNPSIKTGVEMLLIGMASAGVTYFIGHLVSGVAG